MATFWICGVSAISLQTASAAPSTAPHPRRQRHPSLQRLRHHPHQHHLQRRGAGEVEDDEGVVDGGFVGADADAGGDGGDFVTREHADGSGGSIQSDGVDEDDAVVAGEVGGEVEGGGAEVFEGGVGGSV